MKDKRYLNCKYLDAGMDGMLCSQELCKTCTEFLGGTCLYFTPKDKAKKKMKYKHGYKRITERLDIKITYKPNGYLDQYDDYELSVTVKDETYTITPFGKQLSDMTAKQLLAEVKDVLEEVLGD